MKKMLTLKNWDLEETIDGRVYANGTVFGHYRLADGEFIHTSVIEKIYLRDEETYVFETYSGSLYQLLKNEMDPQRAEITKERMKIPERCVGKDLDKRLEIATETFKTRRMHREQLLGNPENAAKEHMDEDGLYLIMERMNVLKAIIKKGDVFKEVRVSVHIGMFQDSVLITDWQDSKVDFRYFPNWRMEPYRWSDGLEYVYIHNIGNHSILFQGPDGDIECKANEVQKIRKEVCDIL